MDTNLLGFPKQGRSQGPVWECHFVYLVSGDPGSELAQTETPSRGGALTSGDSFRLRAVRRNLWGFLLKVLDQ